MSDDNVPDIGHATIAWRAIRNVLRDCGYDMELEALEEITSGYEHERKMRDGAERQKDALEARVKALEGALRVTREALETEVRHLSEAIAAGYGDPDTHPAIQRMRAALAALKEPTP